MRSDLGNVLSLQRRALRDVFTVSGWQRKSQPSFLDLSTATVMSGNLLLICIGSSPYSFAVPPTVTCWKPLVFLLYPLESTAMFLSHQSWSSCRSLRIISVCGVFPVPPTVMLPTQMEGTSVFCTLRNPLSNMKCLVFKASQYGNSKNLSIIYHKRFPLQVPARRPSVQQYSQGLNIAPLDR